MKKLHIQAFLMAFIIMMPLIFSSVSSLSETKGKQELCENPSGEEQNEERDSEEEKETKNVKEFMHQTSSAFSVLQHGKSSYYFKTEKFSNINGDVLTPPPKFI